MLKIIWRKIKQNHLLMMALCCLVPIVLIVGWLALFRGSSDYWFWLIILLCPVLHIWMMKGHRHNKSCEHETDKKNKLYKCPACGLKYKEQEWAEKCEEWCKKHKSCNLEITKHALARQK